MTAEIDAVVDRAVAQVGQSLARELSDVERKIALALFWARASTRPGTWIEVIDDGPGVRLVLEPIFEQGFVALATRILRGRKHLGLVA